MATRATRIIIGKETEYRTELEFLDIGQKPSSKEAENEIKAFIFRHLIEELGKLGGVPFDLASESVLPEDFDGRIVEVDGSTTESHLLSGFSPGLMLPEGRFYIDHWHLETSTRECGGDSLHKAAWNLLLQEKLQEEIVRFLQKKIEERFPKIRLLIHKNNTDLGKNSWGTHLNILIKRGSFAKIEKIIPFKVSSIIWGGAGDFWKGRFVISQRARHFSRLASLDTMSNRGLINLRDEPHALPDLFRKHIIIPDAKRCEPAIYLEAVAFLGAYKALDEGLLEEAPMLENPVDFFHKLSLRDPRVFETALKLQRWYAEKMEELFPQDEGLEYLQDVLERLEKDPESLVGELDYLTKKQIIEKRLKKEGLEPGSARARDLKIKINFQYPDIRAGASQFDILEESGEIIRLLDEEDIQEAKNLNLKSRARILGRLQKEFPEQIQCANWVSLTTRAGQKIVILDPRCDDEKIYENIVSNFFKNK